MKIHEIEKGREIPLRNSINYPFFKMEVGDSVFFERTNEETLRMLARRVQPAMFHYKKHNEKFVSRTIKEENGVRVWRVE